MLLSAIMHKKMRLSASLKMINEMLLLTAAGILLTASLLLFEALRHMNHVVIFNGKHKW